MSLKKLDDVRADKGFKIFDLVIYAAIIVAIAAIFLAVFLTRDTGGLSGFEIYREGKLIYSFSFDGGETFCDNNFVETERGEGSLTIKITAGSGKNTAVADLNARTVRMTEANCSTHKDCVYTPAIRDNSGVIICSPHGIKIVPDSSADPGEFTQ